MKQLEVLKTTLAELEVQKKTIKPTKENYYKRQHLDFAINSLFSAVCNLELSNSL